MTTSGADFYHDELDPEQIESLLANKVISANEVVEGLWHGQVRVRTNAARGVRYIPGEVPEPGEAMLRISAKDSDVGVRSAIVTALANGLGSHPVALPVLFDAVLDGGEGIRDTALQGLERRLLKSRVEVLPFFVAALGDVRAAVSAAASQLLVKAGGHAAIPSLVPLLASDDPRPRRAAYDILDRMKRDAVTNLIDALRNPKSRMLGKRLLLGVGEVSDADRAKLEHVRDVAQAAGNVDWYAAADQVLADIFRPVEIIRTAPANVSLAGFFERALDDGEVTGGADSSAAQPGEVDELLHALKDGRGFVRENAARCLALSDAAQATSAIAAKVVNRLGPILRDPDVGVRKQVARALGALGGVEAVHTLVGGLADPEAPVREAAVEALVGLGPETMGDVLEAVHAADPPVVVRTFEGVRQIAARFGASAVQSFADALKGDRDLTALGREVACLALGDIGTAAEDAIPALLGLLRDTDEGVRAAAATALGFIGVDDVVVLDDLKRLLGDSVSNVRRQAALAAARITGRPLDDRSPSEPRVVPIAHFEDEVLGREALRQGTANAGVELLPLLTAALRDGREVVRQNAARALGTLADAGHQGLDNVAMPVALLLRDGDVAVRKAAVATLTDFGLDALPAAWALSGALADPDDDVRNAVIAALVALFPDVQPYLIEALRTDTPSADKGIFVVWYRLAGAGIDALAAAANDASALIRLNACRALELNAKQGAANALEALEARLSDPVGQVRVAAQAAIDAIGGKPRPPIVIEPEPVDIDGWFERLLDDDVLAQSTDAIDAERLQRQMRDGRPYVRANAAALLGHHRTSDALAAALPGLGVLARDESKEVRARALTALGRILRLRGLGGAETVGLLVGGIGDAEAMVRDAASDALVGLGHDVLGDVLASVHAGAPSVVTRSFDAIRKVAARLGTGAVQALADALKGRELTALGREVACLALGDLGAAAEDAVPALLGLLRDADESVRAAAATALGAIGVDDAIVIEDLRRLLGDSVPDVRRQAALAAARIAGHPLDERVPSEPPTIPIAHFGDQVLERDALREGAAQVERAVLITALRDGRPIVRQNAARALGTLAADGQPGFETVSRPIGLLLRDSEVEVRKAAIAALADLGRDALPAAWFLTGALTDGDDDVRGAVIDALVALFPDVLPYLVEALRTDTKGAEKGVFVVWYRLAGSGIEALADATKSSSALIRLNACRALELLAKQGASNAMKALEARLADPVGQVRAAAEAAIDAIGGKPRPPIVIEPDPVAIDGWFVRLVDDDVLARSTDEVDPVRLQRHMRDGRPYVRANAALLLGHHAPSSAVTAALPGLAVLARDANATVRARAFTALSRVLARGERPEGVEGSLAGAKPSIGVEGSLAGAKPSIGVEGSLAGAKPSIGVEGSLAGAKPSIGVEGSLAGAKPSIGVVGLLLGGLADSDAAVRDAVMTGLVALGPEVLGDALEAVRMADPRVVARTFEGIRKLAARLGEGATQAIADALQGGRELTSLGREAACLALADLGDAAVDAVPALLGLLRDPDESVRAAAAASLGAIGVDDPIVLDDLKRLLADSVPNVRREAALAGARITGKPLDDRTPSEPRVVPIPGFADAILDRDALRAALAGPEVLAVLPVLMGALRDGRAIVRQNAARAIGTLALDGHAGIEGSSADAKPSIGMDKAVAQALGLLLRDGEVDVRKAAVEALADLGRDALAAAWFLSGALVDPDDEVRGAVIAALVGLYPDVQPYLVEALRTDPARAEKGIFVAWFRVGGAGIEALAAATRDGSALIRMNACRALELLAKNGASNATEALEARLSDPVGQVRVAAQAAIDAIGGKPRPPIVLEPDPVAIEGWFDHLVDDALLERSTDVVEPPRLQRHMRDGRPWVRANAAILLGYHAGSDALTAALPGLAVLARDSANEVRARALTALGRVLARGDGPVEIYGDVLVFALSDRSRFVRKAANAALSALGERAFPALALGLAYPDDATLTQIIALLVALGEPALHALPDALSPLTPELHYGALKALYAFSREGVAPARPLVDPLSRDAEPHVRAAAVALLDRIDGKDLIPATLEPVTLPTADFADALLSRAALAAVAGDLRFDLLVRALTDGRDIVRANAATGIEVLGSAHEVAWPHLVRALKDPSIEVRLRAAEALKSMAPRRDVAFDLVRRLDDPSPRVIAAAEAALKAYGEFAIDAFMYALDDRPELVGRSILPMLAGLGAKAVDSLVLSQRYDSNLVRLNGLRGIRLLGKELATSTRIAVSQARKDEDRDVRLEALRLLDWIDGVEHSFLREPRVLPTDDFATTAIASDDARRLASAAAKYDAATLTELLIDGRRMVRENAAAAHGLVGRFHPWLGILLKDSVGAVQIAAAKTLQTLGDKSLPVANAIVGALLEDEEDVRLAAKETLLAFGPKALPVLIDGLWAPPDIARKTVVPFLEALGKDATPAVIGALDHPSQLVVLNALQVLARLYGKDEQGAVKGMPRVQALVKNPLPAIIGAAQKCLFRLEGRTPAEFQKDAVPMPIVGFDKGPLSVDALRAGAPALDIAWTISALADGRPIVRENAARAVGFMPKSLKDLLIPLTIALKDGVPEVQVAAADAFASLAQRAPDDVVAVAVPALTFALKYATERVKRACMVALDAYGPDKVARELVKHLVGREDWMLDTIGKVAARMAEVLVPALARFATLEDESLVARENAVRVLSDLGQKARAAEPTLLGLLPYMEGMLACKAAFALGRVARPSKELMQAMTARLQLDPRPSLHLEVRSAVKILRRRMPPGTA